MPASGILAVCIASVAAVSVPGTAKAPANMEDVRIVVARQVVADQAFLLTGSRLARFSVVDGRDVGFLTRADAGVVTLPLDLLRAARSVGDVRALLAVRAAYADDGPTKRPNRVARAILDYAGLLVSEHVRGRNLEDPDWDPSSRPPSELDNPPPGHANYGQTAFRVRKAMAAGGCESSVVAALERLAHVQTEDQTRGRLQRDAGRVLRDLGMFAHHPSATCDREENAAFAQLTSLLRSE